MTSRSTELKLSALLYRQVWVVLRACEVDSRTDYIAVVELCFDLALGALIKLILDIRCLS